MNILIVANHWPVASARYAADAFTRLGHTVRHVGPAKGRDIWGLTLPAEYVWEPDYWMADFKPDLVVVMDSDPAVLNDMQGMQERAGSPVIVYGVDNHVRDYRRPWFDWYFLAHKSVSVMPWTHELSFSWMDETRRVGNADMTWLPCAYDPTIFTPSTIPWAEREYDVCMIGVMYSQRWQLVQAMRAAGLKVFAGTGLVYGDCAKAYRNSRVSLCASAAGDLAQRVFETAACGCAVLSDPVGDLTELDPNHLTSIYHSAEEAVVKAVKLNAKPEDTLVAGFRDSMAELVVSASVDWAAPHTWDARAQVIIDWYNSRASEGERNS